MIKTNEGYTGVMTLRDETQMDYRIIRATRNLSKLIFYNEKGLKEIFKSDMNEAEKENSERLKKLSEQELMKLGYVSEMALKNIKTLN